MAATASASSRRCGSGPSTQTNLAPSASPTRTDNAFQTRNQSIITKSKDMRSISTSGRPFVYSPSTPSSGETQRRSLNGTSASSPSSPRTPSSSSSSYSNSSSIPSPQRNSSIADDGVAAPPNSTGTVSRPRLVGRRRPSVSSASATTGVIELQSATVCGKLPQTPFRTSGAPPSSYHASSPAAPVRHNHIRQASASEHMLRNMLDKQSNRRDHEESLELAHAPPMARSRSTVPAQTGRCQQTPRFEHDETVGVRPRDRSPVTLQPSKKEAKAAALVLPSTPPSSSSSSQFMEDQRRPSLSRTFRSHNVSYEPSQIRTDPFALRTTGTAVAAGILSPCSPANRGQQVSWDWRRAEPSTYGSPSVSANDDDVFTSSDDEEEFKIPAHFNFAPGAKPPCSKVTTKMVMPSPPASSSLSSDASSVALEYARSRHGHCPSSFTTQHGSKMTSTMMLTPPPSPPQALDPSSARRPPPTSPCGNKFDAQKACETLRARQGYVSFADVDGLGTVDLDECEGDANANGARSNERRGSAAATAQKWLLGVIGLSHGATSTSSTHPAHVSETSS